MFYINNKDYIKAKCNRKKEIIKIRKKQINKKFPAMEVFRDSNFSSLRIQIKLIKP